MDSPPTTAGKDGVKTQKGDQVAEQARLQAETIRAAQELQQEQREQ